MQDTAQAELLRNITLRLDRQHEEMRGIQVSLSKAHRSWAAKEFSAEDLSKNVTNNGYRIIAAEVRISALEDLNDREKNDDTLSKQGKEIDELKDIIGDCLKLAKVAHERMSVVEERQSIVEGIAALGEKS